MRIAVTFLLAIWACGAMAQNALLPGLFDVAGVAEDDVLNVRASPSASSPAIGELAPTASRIEVVELSDTGNWGLINIGESAGWVSMAFLNTHDAALWWELDNPLYCYGNEPFWNLTLSTELPMTLDQLGYDPMALESDWIAPAWDPPVSRALKLRGNGVDAMALVQGLACNDTMSDRAFGLSLRLMLKEDGTTAPRLLSGCCTLQDFRPN